MAGTHTPAGTESEALRVLLVEDDEFVRQTILWTLEDEGIGAMAAVDGEEAIERLEAARPSLVLLDIGLPRVDGFGVADRLRALYGAALPVVVLTADGRAAEKARRVGAVAYLYKPFEISDLVRTVRTVLSG